MRKIADGVAWARKYLQAASFSWFMEEARMRGTKPNRFSSRPNHIENHVWAEMVIRTPERTAVMKRILAGLVDGKVGSLWVYLFIEIGKLSGFLAMRLRTPCLDVTTSLSIVMLREFSLESFRFIHEKYQEGEWLGIRILEG